MKSLTKQAIEYRLDEWSLNNGASCVVAEMPDAPLTCLDIWFKAGSIKESSNKEGGIAHFLEHMVFKGSKTMKEGEFDLEIERIGGSSNAATGLDDVHFHVLVPPEHLVKAIDPLLELVLNPQFKSEALDTEREVVLEEITQNNDQPEETLFQRLFSECWPNHNYGKPILGTERSIKSITAGTMKAFHERNYIGDNCTFAIAGNVPKDINKIIENSKLSEMKGVSENNIQKQGSNKLIFKPGRKEVLISRLESPRFVMAWPLPPAKDQTSLMGADIATTILAEGRRSRIVQKLREDLQVVEAVDMDLTVLEQGGLIILEICCPEENLILVENEIQNIIKQLAEGGPSHKEIKRAHKLVENGLIYGLEISNQVAHQIGSQALWSRHQPLLESLKLIPYWDKETLSRKIYSIFDPFVNFILIARPE